MRTIREIARLHLNKHLSLRAIAGAFVRTLCQVTFP